MKKVFNPFTGNPDFVGGIPQLEEDPSSPSPEDVWVKATLADEGGKIKAFAGLGFPILSVKTGTSTYELSFFTKEGNIKRVNLT